MTDRHYLELLAKDYPTIAAASSEIINLNAICCLPKGTEYFFSDLHGESEAFRYLLNSASGVVRDKIETLFQNSVGEADRALLSALIYQPEETLQAQQDRAGFEDWCRITIYRLVQVCRAVDVYKRQHQVHGDHGELGGSAALQEQYLVIVRDVHDLP